MDAGGIVRLSTRVAWATTRKLLFATSHKSLQPGLTHSLISRGLSSESSSTPTTDGEKQLFHKLQTSFPKAAEIHVQDVSGGCGSMYEVYVVAEEFRGKGTVAQHRMVNEALKEELKSMHGIRISTTVPES